MKTLDYINRVTLTLPLSVYEGTWTHSPPLVAMHLLDRSCVIVEIFLKLHATFPNTGSISVGSEKKQREHLQLPALLSILVFTSI